MHLVDHWEDGLRKADDMRTILFKATTEPDLEDGGYIATTPTLPGVVGQGETEAEAVRDLQVALDFTLEDMALSGEEPPEDDESARGLPTIDDIAPRAYRAELAV